MHKIHIRVGLVLGLLLALGVAGCGGADDDDQVATAGGDGSSATGSAAPDGLTGQERALEYSKCMRENGLRDFPDPDDQGRLAIDVNKFGGPNDPTFKAAEEKCKQYLPTAGEPEQEVDPEQVEQMRQYAKCMRENGVPDFPDPNDEGGIDIDADKLGMEPNDPTFKAAEEKCANMPGAPTGGDSQRNDFGANS